jgi:hypothetical protein
MKFHIIEGFAANLWFRGEDAKPASQELLRHQPPKRFPAACRKADGTRRNTDRGKEPAKPTPLGISHVNFQRKTR